MPGRSSNSANPNDDYKFIGEELDDEAGLTLMNLNARTYDPITARFMQIDPLFDHPDQVGLSPYNYAWNDPVNLSDPSGECPACWGAAIGFAVELGTQIAVDMIANDASFGDALGNVDWVDVGTSTLSGAATGGLSSVKNAGTLIKGGTTIALSVAEDATKANTGSQTSEYGMDDAIVSATTGLVSTVGGEVAETYARGTREGQKLDRIVTHMEGRPMTHSNVRSLDNARTSASNYRSSRGQIGSAVARSGGTGVLNGTGTANSTNRSFILSPSSSSGGARADNTRVAIPLKIDF
jgi:RHS repeat-associated protein